MVTIKSKEEASELDEILSHILDGSWHDSESLYKSLYPNKSESEVSRLIKKIIAYNNDLVIQPNFDAHESMIMKSDGIHHFLESGGFLKIYEDKIKEHENNERMNQKAEQVLDLKITTLIDAVIESPKVKGRLNRAEIIAGLSALAAIVSAIVAIVAMKK